MNRNIKRTNMEFDQVGRQMGLRPGMAIEGIRNVRHGMVEIIVSASNFPTIRSNQQVIRSATPKELFRGATGFASLVPDAQALRTAIRSSVAHHIRENGNKIINGDVAGFASLVADHVIAWMNDEDHDMDEDDDDEEGPEIVGHIFESWSFSPQDIARDEDQDFDDPTFYFRPGGGLFPPKHRVEEASVVTAIMSDGSRQVIKNRYGKTDVPS